MKENWRQALEEESGKDFEDRVMAKVGPLLNANAETARAERKRVWGIRFALSAAALTLVIAIGVVTQSRQDSVQVAGAEDGIELEIALEFEMVRDIHAIEHLELLQELGDPDTWRVRKKKNGKV